MTDNERKRRRGQIKQAAEQPRTPHATYWATRGKSAAGVLDPNVSIWIRAPYRVDFVDGETRWYAEVNDPSLGDHATGGEPRSAFWACWTLVDCARMIGTIPDDDRQCLRKEGDMLAMASVLPPAVSA